MKLRNWGLVALVALAAVALAQDSFKLRRTPTVGETVTMRLTADVEVMGMNAVFTAKVTEKVTKVDENGNYTVESTQGEGKVKFGDQEMDAPAGTPTTTLYSAGGEVLEMTGDQVNADAFRIANLSAINVPDKAFAKGDKHDYEIKASEKNGNTAGKGSLEVLGTEKVGDWDTIKIKYTYKETSGAEPAEGSGTIWLSAKDKSMVKYEGEYKNAPFPGTPGPINAKIKIERI